MNTETDYMNGGVTNALIALAAKSGYKPTAEELLTAEAHKQMPRGVMYTHSALIAKRNEIKAHCDALLPGWENDSMLDLYGLPAQSDRPRRMSAYDRNHTTRKVTA